MKRPSFQFYPQDWLREESLRLVSLAARGLWIDMIAIMHNSDPYGHLVVGGTAIDDTTLARLVGETPVVTRALVRELEKFKIFSRTEDGTIFSRRMVRDEAVRIKRAECGALATKNPNASRAGDTRLGGRTKTPIVAADAPLGGTAKEPLDSSEGVPEEPLNSAEGVPEEPLTDPPRGYGKNPPSSSSSSSSPSSRDTDTAPNGTVSGSRRRAPLVDPGPSFGDLEPDVLAFIATVAAENKSGTITDARTATLRRDLQDALDRIGDRAAFTHGIREAVRRGAGNVNYAIKAASGYSPLIARALPRDVPEEPESLADQPFNDYDVPEDEIYREAAR